jgi:hypothetical protein
MLGGFLIAFFLSGSAGQSTNVARCAPTRFTVEGADVALLSGDARDPNFRFDSLLFGFRVDNNGPDVALDVDLLSTLQEGTELDRLEVDYVPEGSTVTCEAPELGQRGDILCHIDRIPVGEQVRINVYAHVSAPPGSTVEHAGSISSGSVDPDLSNNTLTFEERVPIPPVITSIRERRQSGEPYRIIIEGANFQEVFPGAVRVFIGPDLFFWDRTQVKRDDKIVLLGGRALKARLPKGVATQVIVFNTDGGSATGYFTR